MTTIRFTLPRLSWLPRLRIKTWVERKHWRRYVLGWIVSTIGVVGMGVSYKMLWPETYTSEMTLILPGAGAGANVSLSSIGQASSVISSPFGQSSLSPKVIYKSIAESDQVLGLAAEELGLEPKGFGKPRIKLIDQTALMIFEVKGDSGEAAQSKGKALLKALDGQLDALRRDEIEKRAGAVIASLADYRNTLDRARQRVLDFQQGSGLVSAGQFTDLTATVEQTKRKLGDLRAEVGRLARQQASLVQEVGLSAEEAARALALSADPNFVRVFRDLADARLQLTDRLSRLGRAHPQVLREEARQSDLVAATHAHLRRAGLSTEQRVLLAFATVDAPARAELVQALVRGEAEHLGKRQQMLALEAELAGAEERLARLSEAAATLEDLQKKQLVAEAVYSSAAARLDTNRADVYASYPLLQVLAEPNLPERPSSPRWLFAIIGIIGGTGLATLAWVMAWLYQLFVLKRLKSG